MNRTYVISTALLVVMACTLRCCYAAQYIVTDLGSLGGFSYANGLNSSGEVVGQSYSSTAAATHAFMYSQGNGIEDLGTLDGTNGESIAWAINDSGQVVGYSSSPNGQRAFVVTGGVMHDLGTLSQFNPSAYSSASGINASGQIVGSSETETPGITNAFLYSGGVMQDLGRTLPTDNFAHGYDINSSSQVVGISGDSGGGYRAMFYSNGVMQDLANLGGTFSQAWAINDSGQIAGFSDITDDVSTHAFLYSNGVMHDLGTLSQFNSNAGSFAYGINAAGHVVGQTATDGDYAAAFVYRDGLMHNLNSMIEPGSGWILLAASDINNGGQIAGWGYFNGESHAYLLTPVPEPGSFALAVIGPTVWIAWRRRWRVC